MKNKYRVEGDMAIIQVYGLGEYHECLIDAEDLQKVSDAIKGYTWMAKWDKSTESFYVGSQIKTSNGKKVHVSIHRIVMDVSDERQVDHIYHNTLDNRKSQLRVVTPSQNSQNKRIYKTNKTNIPGVSWCKRDKVYVGIIQINGKRHHIGRWKRLSLKVEKAMKKARQELSNGGTL